MQIPLLRGRDLSPADNQATPGVVIVNEAFVRKYFSPGDDPIGKRIVFGNPEKGAPWLTIIGTAKDARQEEWAAAPEPEAYLAALQNKEYLEDPSTHTGYLTVVVRTQIDPAKMIGSVRAAVRSFDPSLPISQVTTMDDAVASANAQPRFELTLLGVFAGLAVVLAAVGIFGVMSYAVTRRTHEIGIRMSLGATTADVLRMVLGSALINAAAGALAGVAGALLFSRLMRSMLYGVRPSDPLTISGAAVIVIGIALLASYVPARAATRVDPNVALRHN
jgi:predicted permease